jgi:hypothetical protein
MEWSMDHSVSNLQSSNVVFVLREGLPLASWWLLKDRKSSHPWTHHSQGPLPTAYHAGGKEHAEAARE